MTKHSPNHVKKALVGIVGLSMVLTLGACSRGKKEATPSASASISASASASASASKSASKKPVATSTPKTKYKPLVPTKPFAKKPYRVTLTPTPEPTLTKDQKVFEAALKKQLGLDMKGWNAKHLESPLEYKMAFIELVDYTKGFLCSYLQTGVDEFTLGSYLDGEVSYLSDVKSGVIKATSAAYGCKPQ